MRAAFLTLVILLPLSLGAADVDRTRPPEPGPPRPVTLPKRERRALSNGLPVVLVQQHEVPTVQVSVVLGAGAAADPADRPGVASLTADMLNEGAGERGALELADALDGLGASLSADAGWDSSAVGLHVPVARLAEALPLLADVVRRPRFDKAELERLRQQTLTSVRQLRDDPGSLAAVALARAVFGRHRYGTMRMGDVRSITALQVDDLRRFHSTHYRPGNATLLVVGDVPPSVVDLLEKTFGDWPAGGRRAADLPAPSPPRARPFWLIDRPGAEQSTVRVGQTGPPRSLPAYHALEVANTLLGGLFTSRLNDNLREQHGYAYGAGSAFSYRRVGGSFFAAADVQTPSTAAGLTEILKEISRIVAPATPDEIGRARSFLARS
jgi:zinc protease